MSAYQSPPINLGKISLWVISDSEVVKPESLLDFGTWNNTMETILAESLVPGITQGELFLRGLWYLEEQNGSYLVPNYSVPLLLFFVKCSCLPWRHTHY